MSRWRKVLPRSEAVRYLMARGFPARADAEQALDSMERLDYGTIVNEAGAHIVWTRHGGLHARYRTRQEALEADAVDRERCTECQATPGLACRSRKVGPRFDQPLKHPHAPRVTRARVQGRV